MVFIPKISLSFYNLWMMSAVFFIINFGTILLFPKYNIGRFVKTLKIKFITPLNYVLYYGFFIFSIFIPLKFEHIYFYIGLIIFISGLFLYIASVFSFAVSEYDKPVTNRMYKFSRHPVYMSFLIIMAGISIASGTFIMIIIAIIHFISTVFIINKEEELCKEKYKKEYIEYKNKVRKYI